MPLCRHNTVYYHNLLSRLTWTWPGSVTNAKPGLQPTHTSNPFTLVTRGGPSRDCPWIQLSSNAAAFSISTSQLRIRWFWSIHFCEREKKKKKEKSEKNFSSPRLVCLPKFDDVCAVTQSRNFRAGIGKQEEVSDSLWNRWLSVRKDRSLIISFKLFWISDSQVDRLIVLSWLIDLVLQQSWFPRVIDNFLIDA